MTKESKRYYDSETLFSNTTKNLWLLLVLLNYDDSCWRRRKKILQKLYRLDCTAAGSECINGLSKFTSTDRTLVAVKPRPMRPFEVIIKSNRMMDFTHEWFLLLVLARGVGCIPSPETQVNLIWATNTFWDLLPSNWGTYFPTARKDENNLKIIVVTGKGDGKALCVVVTKSTQR